MKKRIVCLTLALLMSATQVVSVSASREDELREEQAITSQQLDATYSRMDELAYAKSQLENEISELDSNLVCVRHGAADRTCRDRIYQHAGLGQCGHDSAGDDVSSVRGRGGTAAPV